MASERRIKVTRSGQVQNLAGGIMGYQFIVTTSDANLMPNEVFRLRRRPLNPTQPGSTQVDDFDGVCTMAELAYLPVGSPMTGETNFRVRQVTLTFDTQGIADEAWMAIRSDIDKLRESMDLADRLGPPEVYWSGAAS